MCVIMVKEKGIAFPEEKTLENCWDNNPHMGGFMYVYDGKVNIRKGYMTFESFMTALNHARSITGDNVPYVCHFRISTQGYDADCCQPFPLSSKMTELKKRKPSCNIGVCHNGILDITSDGSKTYSDTMKFITDFLVNIIRNYSWYKDERTCTLIENLIVGSKFAIMDKSGHIERMGNGWELDTSSGCWYSNSSYSYKKYKYTPISKSVWDDTFGYDSVDWGFASSKGKDKGKKKKSKWNNTFWNETGTLSSDKEYYESFYSGGMYHFNEIDCPFTAEDDDRYCWMCSNQHSCSYVKSCSNL